MKVLIIGSGAREHAITWKLKQSERIDELYVAPGNAGIAEIAHTVAIKADDLEGLKDFAVSHEIDLTVVGPEVPLVMGITDLFEANDLRVFGPDKACSTFEGSKAFSKDFMAKYEIPTAAYAEYRDLELAKSQVAKFGFPLVIKADGLAAGKGVVICADAKEAERALDEMMSDKVFGEAGNKVVFEEFLTGIEASVLCFVDGKTILPMTSAQDYKKAFDGDQGLNTGGMGAYSPSRLFDERMDKHVDEMILQPFIKGTQAEGLNYKGVIFIGLMIKDGAAKVIEFNCRMGDPETQVVLPRMENDLLDIIDACIDGHLDEIQLKWSEESTVSVVLASGGYPGKYEKKKHITGLDHLQDVIAFHAGTLLEDDKLLTNGGRVLNIVAKQDSIKAARELVYDNIQKVSYEKMMFRNDIAKF